MRKPLYLTILFLLLTNFAQASHPNILCPQFARSLAFGSRGTDVSDLQKFLASSPVGGQDTYPEGLVTGYFGKLTEKATQRFQVKHGVVLSGSPATTGYGVLGPKTRAKFKEVCEASNFSHEIVPVAQTPTPLPETQITPTPAPISSVAGTPTPTQSVVVATSTPTPTVVIGSYEGATCTLEVEPKVAILSRDRPEATWKIYSSPIGWHFYWHDIVNGKDEGDVYGGVTNKFKTEEYAAVVAKYTKYAHVVIEQNHVVSTSSADKVKHSDAVCTTNTVTFEIKESY